MWQPTNSGPPTVLVSEFGLDPIEQSERAAAYRSLVYISIWNTESGAVNDGYRSAAQLPFDIIVQSSKVSLRARQHFSSAKILRTCVYGTPYSIPGAPDDYMEYRKYTFFEFSQQENASCPQCIEFNWVMGAVTVTVATEDPSLRAPNSKGLLYTIPSQCYSCMNSTHGHFGLWRRSEQPWASCRYGYSMKIVNGSDFGGIALMIECQTKYWRSLLVILY